MYVCLKMMRNRSICIQELLLALCTYLRTSEMTTVSSRMTLMFNLFNFSISKGEYSLGGGGLFPFTSDGLWEEE